MKNKEFHLPFWLNPVTGNDRWQSKARLKAMKMILQHSSSFRFCHWLMDNPKYSHLNMVGKWQELTLRLDDAPVNIQNVNHKVSVQLCDNKEVLDELWDIAAIEVTNSIDRKAIERMRAAAGTRQVFDFATAMGDTLLEKFESLRTKITELSNIVWCKTFRGPANFAIMSTTTAHAFWSYGASAASNATTWTDNLFVHHFGSMGNVKIYADPLMKDGEVILGYIGKDNHDGGLFIPVRNLLSISDELSEHGHELFSEMDFCVPENGHKFFATLNVINFLQ